MSCRRYSVPAMLALHNIINRPQFRVFRYVVLFSHSREASKEGGSDDSNQAALHGKATADVTKLTGDLLSWRGTGVPLLFSYFFVD